MQRTNWRHRRIAHAAWSILRDVTAIDSSSDLRAAAVDDPADDSVGAIFVDLDTVLIQMHRGQRGLELGLNADLPEAFERLAQITDQLFVLVDPPPTEDSAGRETERRLEVLRAGMGTHLDRLTIVGCPHGEDRSCDCAKPGIGLIELAVAEHGARRRGGWHIGGDQEGVQVGRTAGLRTIRIGPAGDDHLSTVHRADHEARDLLDAANRIMLEALAV